MSDVLEIQYVARLYGHEDILDSSAARSPPGIITSSIGVSLIDSFNGQELRRRLSITYLDNKMARQESFRKVGT